MCVVNKKLYGIEEEKDLFILKIFIYLLISV